MNHKAATVSSLGKVSDVNAELSSPFIQLLGELIESLLATIGQLIVGGDQLKERNLLNDQEGSVSIWVSPLPEF